MTKYKVFVPGIIPECKAITVEGWKEVDKKAKELLDKYVQNYPDVQVWAMERFERLAYADYVYAFMRDAIGEDYWQMNVMGDYMPLYTRLLNDEERHELENRRNEVDRHITDLNADELKELWTQVDFGSMFLSSYQNSFNIDEDEVYDYCEFVLDECDRQGYTNNPNIFANIILEKI